MISKVTEKRMRNAAEELFNLLQPKNSPVPDDLDKCELWVARASRIKNEEGESDITLAEMNTLTAKTQELVKLMQGELGGKIIANTSKEKNMKKEDSTATETAPTTLTHTHTHSIAFEKDAKKKVKKTAAKKVTPKKEVPPKKVEKKTTKKEVKKETKLAKKVTPKKEKVVVERTKHGHRTNTAMGMIDTMMLDGGTDKEAVHKALVKAFPSKKYTTEQTHHYLRTFAAGLRKRDINYSCSEGTYKFKK